MLFTWIRNILGGAAGLTVFWGLVTYVAEAPSRDRERRVQQAELAQAALTTFDRARADLSFLKDPDCAIGDLAQEADFRSGKASLSANLAMTCANLGARALDYGASGQENALDTYARVIASIDTREFPEALLPRRPQPPRLHDLDLSGIGFDGGGIPENTLFKDPRLTFTRFSDFDFRGATIQNALRGTGLRLDNVKNLKIFNGFAPGMAIVRSNLTQACIEGQIPGAVFWGDRLAGARITGLRDGLPGAAFVDSDLRNASITEALRTTCLTTAPETTDITFMVGGRSQTFHEEIKSFSAPKFTPARTDDFETRVAELSLTWPEARAILAAETRAKILFLRVDLRGAQIDLSRSRAEVVYDHVCTDARTKATPEIPDDAVDCTLWFGEPRGDVPAATSGLPAVSTVRRGPYVRWIELPKPTNLAR